jgi:LPXTG-motif cell wall-anchored protein
MPLDLPAAVTAIIALSVAAERVVEIVKGIVVWLDKEKESPKEEARRRATLQGLAAVAGILVSVLAWPVTKTLLPETGNPTSTIVAFGLLASGGAGFWNSILGYVMSVKALKSADAAAAKQSATLAGAMALPQPTEGRFRLDA